MSRGPPKARSCYICGRQYMLHSFAIHEVQCRKMFDKWEMEKPPKERRKCPEDPMRGYNPNMSMKELDKLNADSQQVWSDQALVRCQNCSRTFLPEKLPIHQRSCTASNPARRIEASPSAARNENEYGAGDSSANRFRDSGKCGGGSDPEELVNLNSGNLMQCKNCGRTFNAVPYSKHIKVCAKVFTAPRKVFNSAKQRIQGTELEDFQRQQGKAKGGAASKRPTGSTGTATSSRPSVMGGASRGGGSGEMPKWKQDSLRFRDAMKAAREVSRAEKKSKETGIPLHLLLPSNPAGGRGGGGARAGGGRQGFDDGGGGGAGAYQEAGALQCPTCGRTFSQKAGERHIPQCKNIIAKPSRLNRNSGVPSYSTMNSEGGGKGTFGNVGARIVPANSAAGSRQNEGFSSSSSGFGGDGGGVVRGGGDGGFGKERPRPSLSSNNGGGSAMGGSSVRSGGMASTMGSLSRPASRPGSAGLSRGSTAGADRYGSSASGGAAVRGAPAGMASTYNSSRPSPRLSEPITRGGGGIIGGGGGGGYQAASVGGGGGGSSGSSGASGSAYRISQSNATSSNNPLLGGRR